MSNITKKLSTGHTIYLSQHDDRMLKRAYEYMAGFAKRVQLLADIEEKRAMINKVHNEIVSTKKQSEQKEQAYEAELRAIDIEALTEQQAAMREELLMAEEKLRLHENSIQTIKASDIDAILRHHNTNLSLAKIEVFIFDIIEI